MTKGEYCKLKGLHTCNPAFNPNDELDDEFKNVVDSLIDNFMTSTMKMKIVTYKLN